MINAKLELLDSLEDIDSSVKCAHIFYGRLDITLNVSYSDAEYVQFLEQLDFYYDNSWDRQNLFGLVWFNDDSSWLQRREYDESESWEICSTPEIPDNLF